MSSSYNCVALSRFSGMKCFLTVLVCLVSLMFHHFRLSHEIRDPFNLGYFFLLVCPFHCITYVCVYRSASILGLTIQFDK